MNPKRTVKEMLRLWPVLLVVWLSGCVIIPGADRDLLKFLEAGKTTREEVLLKLGQPSATLEQERVLTYRIGEDSQEARYVIAARAILPWQQVQYSLVLVFDGNGRLEKQSLVRVQ